MTRAITTRLRSRDRSRLVSSAGGSARRGKCQHRAFERLHDSDHVALGVLEPRRLEIASVEDTVDRLHRRVVVFLEHDSLRPEITQALVMSSTANAICVWPPGFAPIFEITNRVPSPHS